MKRCVIMVSGGSYRAPGQCAKKHGLKRVKMIDRTVLICKHHQNVIEAGRVLPVKARAGR